MVRLRDLAGVPRGMSKKEIARWEREKCESLADSIREAGEELMKSAVKVKGK